VGIGAVLKQAADALSRFHDQGKLSSFVSYSTWCVGAKLLQEAKQDANVQKIITEFQ
jgi:hypothetical protein